MRAWISLAGVEDLLGGVVGDDAGVDLGAFEMEAKVVVGVFDGEGVEGMGVGDA